MLATLLGCSDEPDEGEGEGEGGTVTKGDDIDESGEVPTVVPNVCEAACTVEEQCLGGSPDACREGCASDHAAYTSSPGASCVKEFEGLLACIGSLNCTDAVAFADGYAETYPCEFEEESFVGACLLPDEPPPAACVAICAKTAECMIGDVSDCEVGCAQQITFATAISEECGTAQTELLVCGEALECAELFGYYEGDPALCAEATVYAETVCAM